MKRLSKLIQLFSAFMIFWVIILPIFVIIVGMAINRWLEIIKNIVTFADWWFVDLVCLVGVCMLFGLLDYVMHRHSNNEP